MSQRGLIGQDGRQLSMDESWGKPWGESWGKPRAVWGGHIGLRSWEVRSGVGGPVLEDSPQALAGGAVQLGQHRHDELVAGPGCRDIPQASLFGLLAVSLTGHDLLPAERLPGQGVWTESQLKTALGLGEPA